MRTEKHYMACMWIWNTWEIPNLHCGWWTDDVQWWVQYALAWCAPGPLVPDAHSLHPVHCHIQSILYCVCPAGKLRLSARTDSWNSPCCLIQEQDSWILKKKDRKSPSNKKFGSWKCTTPQSPFNIYTVTHGLGRVKLQYTAENCV